MTKEDKASVALAPAMLGAFDAGEIAMAEVVFAKLRRVADLASDDGRDALRSLAIDLVDEMQVRFPGDKRRKTFLVDVQTFFRELR